MALEKIELIEKEQLCKQIYEDYIVKYAKILEEYELYSDTIEANLPDSCYTNFRDALFHFRKLVYSSEEKELICQEFAIKEHLSRALTDAASAVLDVLTWVAEEMLKDNDILDDWKKRIRIMLHEMKKTFLMKRFGGMMITDDAIKVDHVEIIKLCDSFIDFSCKNCKDVFAKYSSKYIYAYLPNGI